MTVLLAMRMKVRSLTWSLLVRIRKNCYRWTRNCLLNKLTETMRGVRSFMACINILEFDSVSSEEDNPFTSSRTSHTSKVSVKVPVDEWLCRKFEKLNLTVQEGYPSLTSETPGLNRDQFLEPLKTLTCYSMHSEKKDFSHSKVYT